MVNLSENNLPLPFAGKHVPVHVALKCFLARPDSVPKKRSHPSVKPDLDKLVRSCLDSLTGVGFKDDGQVVHVTASKDYGAPERVEITVTAFGENPVETTPKSPAKPKKRTEQPRKTQDMYFDELGAF